jgi:ABC-type iron transport system FetAB permease component
MKKIALVSLFTLLFLNIVISQAPNLMSYQAVIWDASGNLVSEKIVNIKINILQDSINGKSVYSEIHRLQTNITKVSEQIKRHFYLDILKIQIGFVPIF